MSEFPPLPPQTDEHLRLVVVDQSRDALDAARDRADARLDQEVGEGGRLRKFTNGIWKGNIAKEYYRQKYIKNAIEEIEASQDVLTYAADSTTASRGRAIDATIERFQSEHDEVIQTDAGEKKEVQQEDSEIAVGFKDMIRRFAEGHLSADALQEERTRFMQAYRETHDDTAFGEGLVTTDNMMSIARAVAGAVEHGESIDSVMAKMQVITGEARNGARTEARYTAVDRAIARLAKTKAGSLVGPEIVISAVTIAATAAKWGSHSVVGAVAKTVAPGLAAGLWSGLRENRRVKDERAQHSREVAIGQEFGDDAVRRNEMEKTRYESLSANMLTEFVRANGNPEQLESGGNAALQTALDSLAQVQSRIDLSNQRNIDLISYTDATSVGDERMALDVARAEVRVALEAQLTDTVRAELGLDATQSVHELIREQAAIYNEVLDDDISAKDKAFRALKARRVAKAAAIGVATGLIGGLVAQEFVAAIDPTRAGLFEQAWGAKTELSIDGTQHQTILEGLAGGGESHVIHTGASESFETYATGGNGGEISLSDDHSLVENGDGTVNFVDPNGNVTIENLAINDDGSLPAESLARLDSAGMAVEDHSFDQEIPTTQQVDVSSEQFVQNHAAETTRVTRDLWYGNNTPDVYDQNELKLHWGGNAGIVDGGYQLSVAGMAIDGSWQGGESVDWNQAAGEGDLFMSISATVDTQTQTFMVPIGPDGMVTIAEDSPAGHFFANENGSAAFTGAYAEVVQTTGIDPEGTVHVRPLATLVGEGGSAPVSDTITTTTTEHHSLYTITTEGYDTTVSNYTEAAPVIPVESRRSLESAIRRERRGPEYYYSGEESLTGPEIARRRGETSPRLIEAPDADLVPAEEFAWYRETLEKKRGASYVAEIDAAVQNTPELANLGPEVKAIVQVPVNAAGDAEAHGIYNLLTNAYGGQSAESLQETVFLLHVNWFDRYDGDDSQVRANIAFTKAEIARAKADRPDLRIAVLESEWKRDEVQSGVIGHVSRKMHDAAILSLDKAANKLSNPTSMDDVLLIRNDSDPKGLATNYLKNYTRSLVENPETDVFTGVTTFDNTKADRLPGLVFAANFMQSLELINSARHGAVHTGGANFGIRASTFAAIGGAGFDEEWTGAGSDDVAIGARVKTAREGSLATSRRSRTAYVSGGYQGYGSAASSSTRRIARKISARIDTNSDRQEALYLQSIPIMNSWDPEQGFDNDGYRPRDAGLGTLGVAAESIRDNPADVLEHIRNDMQRSVNVYPSAVVESGLRFAFMGIGAAGYELKRRTSVNPQSQQTETRFELTFTAAGEAYLINHLTRDIKGKFDSYGARKRRQLYGQVKPGAARQSDRQSLFAV